MYEVLPVYYALLYIVFTKWERDLGKGVSLVVYDEEPLIRHYISVFGADYLAEAQRVACKFPEDILERDPYVLREHRRRLSLLEWFEKGFEAKLQGRYVIYSGIE